MSYDSSGNSTDTTGPSLVSKPAHIFDNCLDPTLERRARLPDVDLVQIRPGLHDGGLEFVHISVGDLAGLGLHHAPYRVVERVEIGKFGSAQATFEGFFNICRVDNVFVPNFKVL